MQDLQEKLEMISLELKAMQNMKSSEDRILMKIAKSIYHDFLGKPSKQKLKFISNSAKYSFVFLKIKFKNLLISIKQIPDLIKKIQTYKSQKKLIGDRVNFQNNPDTVHIACNMKGGVGDLLQYLVFLKNLHKKFKNASIDVYVYPFSFEYIKEVLPYFKESFSDFINNFYFVGAMDESLYDLKIELSHVSQYFVLNEPKLSKEQLGIINLSEKRVNPIKFLINNNIGMMHVCRIMGRLGKTVLETIGYFGGIDVDKNETINLKKTKRKISEEYITVQGTSKFMRFNTELCTRDYPYFEEVIKLIKKENPDIKIVQIGYEKEAIEGVDISLLGEPFLDCISTIEHASLHIGTENGLQRIAWAHGVKGVAAVGPTITANYYQLKGIENINATYCGDCHWITDDWYKKCPRGFKTAKCMESIDPKIIAETAIKILKG